MNDRRAFLKLLTAAIATASPASRALADAGQAPSTGSSAGGQNPQIHADFPAAEGPVLSRTLCNRARGRVRRDRDADHRQGRRGRRGSRGSPHRRPSHPFGHEHGPLASAALERRPGRRRRQRQGNGGVAPQRGTLGRRYVLLVPAVVDAKTSYRDATRDRKRSSASACCPLRNSSTSSSRWRRCGTSSSSARSSSPATSTIRLAVPARVFRRGQRRVVCVPARLDPYAGIPDRQDPSQGLQFRSTRTVASPGKTSAKGTSTGWPYDKH